MNGWSNVFGKSPKSRAREKKGRGGSEREREGGREGGLERGMEGGRREGIQMIQGTEVFLKYL